MCRFTLQTGIISISKRLSDFSHVTELVRIRSTGSNAVLRLNTLQCCDSVSVSVPVHFKNTWEFIFINEVKNKNLYFNSFS